MAFPTSDIDPRTLAERLQGVRAQWKALTATLDAPAWMGPRAAVLNPPLWEFGHVVWFQEHWCLRVKPGRDPRESPLLEPLEPSARPWTDWRYDSSRIPHEARWEAPLLSVEDTAAWGDEVLERVADRLTGVREDADLRYYAELCLYHECMHVEALWMMWQWRGLAPPWRPESARFEQGASIALPAGPVELGARREGTFVFDNEKWAHDITVPAFEIDDRPVLCGEFLAFIDAGGYGNSALWTEEGRRWLAAAGTTHPCYWRPVGRTWERKRFDQWVPVDEREPILHVTQHEARAYAAWRSRRLPSAAEWLRASREPAFRRGGCWEWTTDPFLPYAGFSPDPYADYSAPWFGSHMELRGAGSFVTDPALARPTFRNFYLPDRADPFVGFRTAKTQAG